MLIGVFDWGCRKDIPPEDKEETDEDAWIGINALKELVNLTHSATFMLRQILRATQHLEQREMSYPSTSGPWDSGIFDDMMHGYPVQSHRGSRCRLPNIEKLDIAYHNNP